LASCNHFRSFAFFSFFPVISLLFFFQAEDGIRDYKVTGVQTCALPISLMGDPLLCSLPELGRFVSHRRETRFVPWTESAKRGKQNVTARGSGSSNRQAVEGSSRVPSLAGRTRSAEGGWQWSPDSGLGRDRWCCWSTR